MDKTQLVYDLFVHRTDTYTEQWYNPKKGGGYYPVRGGTCTHEPRCKVAAKCSDRFLVPIEKKDILAHLKGTKTVGVYQLGEGSTVKWACLDVDINKNAPSDVTQEELRNRVQQHTLNIAKSILTYFGKGTFLVEDTGNKGYHIWAFFDEPLSASIVHSVFNWINVQTEAPQGIHVEVFPKQVNTSRFGNLVKVPLGIHKKTQRRCLFVGHTFEALPDQWEALREVKKLTKDDLRKFMKEQVISESERKTTTETSHDKSNSFICMQRIMEEGLIEGTRDAGIYRLALFLKNRDLPSDIALAAVKAVNDKSFPPMEDELVEYKIDSAFASTYSPFPCSDQLINPYCSSKCRFWKGKVNEHWERYGKDAIDAIGVISRD